MLKYKKFITRLTLSAGILFSFSQHSVGHETKTLNIRTPSDVKTIEALIRNYILKHPEIIIKSLDDMEKQKKAAEHKLQASRIKNHLRDLERDEKDPVIGNLDGDITIVEFFDYQCGYCRIMINPLLELLREDGKTRIVMKEFPILGPLSMLAAKASLASMKQNKYEAFHTALMRLRGRLTKPAIFQIGAEVGLNIRQLKKEMSSPEILNQIKNNLKLGRNLSIRGTPAFIIGGRIFPGALTELQLNDLITTIRNTN